MAVQGISGIVQAAIQRASQATGVDFSFLMKTARRESGFNPAAKAATSSAAGLFQFVDQTWLSMLKQHGAKHGYARYADLIERGSNGHYHVASDEGRKAIMDLRLDPHAASLMAGELTSASAAYLKGRTGRQPTAGELYAAHFLGPQGSAKLIEAVERQPGATAAQLFPDAAHANKPIFYKDGRAVSVSEVFAFLNKAVGTGPVTDGKAPAAAGDGDFIQYASARNLDRQAQQQQLIGLILRGSHMPGFGSGDAGGGDGVRLAGSMFTTEMLQMLSNARKS